MLRAQDIAALHAQSHLQVLLGFGRMFIAEREAPNGT